MVNGDKVLQSVCCVVVTFNGEEWIRRCLTSLVSSTFPVTTIIVDNGSVDNTCNIIRSEFPQFELVTSEENLGFGKGNNLGITMALARGVDFVFLLNQDAWIGSHTIQSLVDVANDNVHYGVLSPMHLQKDTGKLDTLFALHIIPPKCELYYDFMLPQKRRVYDCGFVNAAAWLMTRKCLKDVGLFEPLFFLYGEDLNYIQRVKFHGFSVGIVPGCSAVHDRSIRKGKKSPNGMSIERETFISLKLLDIHSSATRRLKGALKLFVKYGWNIVTIKLFFSALTRLRKYNRIVGLHKKKSYLIE